MCYHAEKEEFGNLKLVFRNEAFCVSVFGSVSN